MSLKMSDPVQVYRLWLSVAINEGAHEKITSIADAILMEKTRYEMVGKLFGIPAWVIGAIHYRESDFDFTSWLANGDPLMRGGVPQATTHVPRGLGPASTWEHAAIISIRNEGWHSGMDWDLVSALRHLEAYNGMGYHKHGIYSPYIWSGTNHYVTGKYSSDGMFDPFLKDKQMGCAAIARALKFRGIDLKEKIISIPG